MHRKLLLVATAAMALAGCQERSDNTVAEDANAMSAAEGPLVSDENVMLADNATMAENGVMAENMTVANDQRGNPDTR